MFADIAVVLFVLICTTSFSSAWQAVGNNNNAQSLTKVGTMSMLAVGDIAPPFELLSYKGNKVKLADFKNKKQVVVFFYPADNSPGCTKEVCEFQKRAPDFKAKGAEVFGISSGSAQDKEKFVRDTKATSLELLVDEGNKVRELWKVPKSFFGTLPGRVTYVIGKDGKVKSIYEDLAKATLHPEKALEAL